jgi:hypothetical protein
MTLVTRRLNDRQAAVLREAVRSHAPQLEEAIGRFPASLSATERDAFEDCLSYEFTATGLLPSDEPNERGLLIESVIDVLMRPDAD